MNICRMKLMSKEYMQHGDFHSNGTVDVSDSPTVWHARLY